jgi:hypothetical protein
MATTYTWTIANMERAQDDYITIVHWRVTGDDSTNTASAYGTISFQQEEGEEIIPFADLTEELVWGWVDEKMDRAEVEASVQAKLDELANPPLISGIPW